MIRHDRRAADQYDKFFGRENKKALFSPLAQEAEKENSSEGNYSVFIIHKFTSTIYESDNLSFILYSIFFLPFDIVSYNTLSSIDIMLNVLSYSIPIIRYYALSSKILYYPS